LEFHSPALIIRFPARANAASRDRLVALLADHDLVAIQEDQIDDPREWTAHFASTAARDDAATALAEDSGFSTLDTRAVQVEDEDWARRTQADLPAVTIGRVTIAPPWDLPPHPNPQGAIPGPPLAGPGIVVVIEPSRGFGTGHHQSTRLCLLLLQSRNLTGLTVADVGTGSGVLAISAAKLGAAFVTAIDSDPDAIENARENIVANGVEKLVEAHVDDLTTTTTPAADLVLANLTGTLLSQHATDLARRVRPGGTLIVSGFNIDERERVRAALTRHFDVSEEAEEDDWHAFVTAKRP
jgi:ribosomal protein L11 methyltransferase